MDILRFIKWWWNKNNFIEKVMTLIGIWVLILFINLFLIGVKGFVIFFLGIVIVMISCLLYNAYQGLKSRWELFQSEREQEAEEIIDTLNGKPKSQTQEFIKRLRERHKLKSGII